MKVFHEFGTTNMVAVEAKESGHSLSQNIIITSLAGYLDYHSHGCNPD